MSEIEVEIADVMIFIGAPYNVKSMAKADSTKLAKRSKATHPILSKRLERSAKGEMRWVIADYPTNALAQEANMSLEEYSEFLIKSFITNHLLYYYIYYYTNNYSYEIYYG